jgi:hypothetical protein
MDKKHSAYEVRTKILAFSLCVAFFLNFFSSSFLYSVLSQTFSNFLTIFEQSQHCELLLKHSLPNIFYCTLVFIISKPFSNTPKHFMPSFAAVMKPV